MIMPKRNGKDACEEIRKINPGIKTLFMSGYTMDAINPAEIMEPGFGFIQKPVVPKNLLKKTREILDKS
jgi:CheY-like chemotaxis protein